jgi:hypothetical protein
LTRPSVFFATNSAKRVAPSPSGSSMEPNPELDGDGLAGSWHSGADHEQAEERKRSHP